MGEPPTNATPSQATAPQASDASGAGADLSPLEPAQAAPGAVPSGLDGLARIWARVKEHKILQWTLAYLGAALALAHGTEIVTQAFEWPHAVPRAVVALLALGLPIAVTLAWYHGHRGARQVTGAEAAIISLLMVIAAVLLVVFVRPSAEHGAAPVAAPEPAAAQATSASKAEPAPPARASAGKPRLAILPFENLSPDPANAFFADGLHEEILSALVNRAPGLEVISRTTMMSYKGRPVTIEQVAQDLGVTHVLEGSVRREGEDVRLTLQLIDAKNDGHLWSQSYDRKLVKAMTLQSEVAGEVAAQLSVKLAGAAAPPTKDPEAYDLYLKARLERQRLNGLFPLEAWRAVEAMLDQALARDPAFGLAYLERFRLNWLLFFQNFDTSLKAIELIRADLATARHLLPGDPRVTVGEAFWAQLDQDNERALALLAAVEARGSEDPDALQLKADILVRKGLAPDSLPIIARAIALDPSNPFLLTYRWFAAMYARQPKLALEALNDAAARVPDLAPLLRNLQGLTVTLWIRDPRALAEVMERTRIDPQSTPAQIRPAAMTYYLVEGKYAEARRTIDEFGADTLSAEFLRFFILAPGIGPTPVAEQRGWLDLLLGDTTSAAKDGAKVLAFVARQEETKWNRWFLRMLTAEGQLFAGNKEETVKSAQAALALAPRAADAANWAIAAGTVAMVFAWAGEKDKAVALLEELSAAMPGLLPGQIVHEPRYTVPLAANARFKALVTKLEAQMAATKLE